VSGGSRTPTACRPPFKSFEFALVVEDADNAPLLIHCGSANRVGDMWALYRALKGIPDEIALEEARTIGLQPDREADVRKWLAERIPTK
jgi:protein tyrosine/serine phosphatase